MIREQVVSVLGEKWVAKESTGVLPVESLWFSVAQSRQSDRSSGAE